MLDKILRVVFILLVGTSPTMASDNSNKKNWSLPMTLSIANKSIDGDIAVDRKGINSGRASADSLGLSDDTTLQTRIGLGIQRWNFGFSYLPVEFSGDGYVEESFDFGDDRQIQKDLPTSTDIKTKLYLLDVLYNFYHRKGLAVGAGGGAGQFDFDITILPQNINDSGGISSQGTTPFGFLSLAAVQEFNQWSVGARVNALDASYGSNRVGYADFNISGGYRIDIGRYPMNVIGGYRWIRFDFAYDDSGNDVNIDIEITGPYIAVAFIF